MNDRTTEGNWMQFKGKLRAQWAKRSGRDAEASAKKREKHSGPMNAIEGRAVIRVDEGVDPRGRRLKAD